MRWIRGVTGLALIAMLPGFAQAQESMRVTLGTGAGASIPMGDFGDRADLGWTAQANLGFTKSTWPVGLRFDVAYHALDGADLGIGEQQDVTILAGLANLELGIARNASGGGLFLAAGGGVYRFDFGDTLVGEAESTEFGIFAGLAYKLAMTNLFVSLEGKLHHVFTEGDAAQLVPIAVVVEIPIAGG